MYLVVSFRDGLELIPKKWCTDNHKSYPPYCAHTGIDKAIQEMEDPGPHWKIYKIKRIFGKTSSYERGMEKLEAATKESDIETDHENLTRKQKRAQRKDSSSDSDFSRSILPAVPTLETPQIYPTDEMGIRLENKDGMMMMVDTVKGIGGHNDYTVVTGVLKKILSNELAEQ